MDNNISIVIKYRDCLLVLAKLDNVRPNRFYEKESVISLAWKGVQNKSFFNMNHSCIILTFLNSRFLLWLEYCSN
jgi:hypothetical protein